MLRSYLTERFHQARTAVSVREVALAPHAVDQPPREPLGKPREQVVSGPESELRCLRDQRRLVHVQCTGQAELPDVQEMRLQGADGAKVPANLVLGLSPEAARLERGLLQGVRTKWLSAGGTSGEMVCLATEEELIESLELLGGVEVGSDLVLEAAG